MIASPIVVEGRLWGAIGAAARRERLGEDTEQRLADFTELVATAIANAESRAELTTSRARIVATADQTRRRIERDLHDGAQQRLIVLALQLRMAQADVPPQLDTLGRQLDQAVAEANSAAEELREIAHGIHPAILTEGGLGPALRTLARRSPIPVDLGIRTVGRLPEPIEVSAYYIVAEALTNATKHADASTITVTVDMRRHHPAHHGPRRRRRRRRLHPRHRPARPQRPRRGTRRPHHPQQPARRGHPPAVEIPSAREPGEKPPPGSR